MPPILECSIEPEPDIDGEEPLLCTEIEEQAIEVIVKMITTSGQGCCPTHTIMRIFDYVHERVVEQIDSGQERLN